MKRLEYPTALAAKLVVFAVDPVNELISKTKRIHSAYLDVIYINGTLEHRVNELQQENRFLTETINKIDAHG